MDTPSVIRRRPAATGWRLVGQALLREFAFRDLDQALAFVEQMGTPAED